MVQIFVGMLEIWQAVLKDVLIWGLNYKIPSKKDFVSSKCPWEKNFELTKYPRTKILHQRNTHKKNSGHGIPTKKRWYDNEIPMKPMVALDPRNFAHLMFDNSRIFYMGKSMTSSALST